MDKPYTIWLTGLPGCGKTTLAKQAVQKSSNLYNLDSDEIRQIITPNPEYKEFEQKIFYRSLIYCALILNENMINVIISATGNKQDYRNYARKKINNFHEIYIECDVQTCINRDPKGLYHQALIGEISTLPIKILGKNEEYIQDRFIKTDIYDPPVNPEMVINTDSTNVESALQLLITYISEL